MTTKPSSIISTGKAVLRNIVCERPKKYIVIGIRERKVCERKVCEKERRVCKVCMCLSFSGDLVEFVKFEDSNYLFQCIVITKL